MTASNAASADTAEIHDGSEGAAPGRFKDSDRVDLAYNKWKIGNCRYLCAVCHDIVLGSLEFGKHVISKHQVGSVKDYKDRHGSARIKEDRAKFKCQLCWKEMFFDYSAMMVHMLNCHAIDDLKKYYIRHVYKAGKAVTATRETADCTSGSSGSSSRSSAMTKASFKVKTEKEDEPAQFKIKTEKDDKVTPFKVKVGDKDALFKVKTEKEDVTLVTVKAEPRDDDDEALLGDFQSSMEEDTFQDEDDGEVKPVPDQMIPEDARGRSAVEEREAVERHVVNQGTNNMCRYQCNHSPCSIVKKHWSALSQHMFDVHGQAKGPLDPRLMSRRVFHDCALCGMRLFCDKTVLSTHAGTAHGLSFKAYTREARSRRENRGGGVSNVVPAVVGEGPICEKVSNLCKYTCTYCDVVKTKWSYFVNHLSKSHGHPRVTFDPSFLTRIAYHKCAVCTQLIYCDKSAIHVHTKEVHGMELFDYMKVAKKGKGNKKEKGGFGA